MLSPPGMPKASVGSRPPPSLAPTVASGAMTPSTLPLPKVSGCLEVCTAWAYANQSATVDPSPGNTPTQTPIREQRITSHQFLNTSRMPCTRPWPRPSVSAMEVRRTARAIISGTAKMPRPTRIRLMPSTRYSPPKAKRSIPVLLSMPTVETRTPKTAAISPLTGAVPESTPTADSPQITNIVNSGEPKLNTRGLRMGRLRSSTPAPNIPPSGEAMKAAPKARLASPFWAMGKPSTMVAWLPELPGTAISTEGKVLAVLDTAPMPNRKAIAG